MIPAASSPPQSAAHPSPHRDRVGPWATWFGILGAPVGWALQQLVNPAILAHGCYPNDTPLSISIWSIAQSVTTGVEAAALVICLAAGLVAWRNWRRTREEKPGSGKHLMEGGDGRTRFLAMVGMICSGLFLIAVLLVTAMFFLVPACSG